jgi:mitochondrial fission protein ELM1
VITGYRAGERTQILGLAEALAETLGWRFEIKALGYTAIDWLPGLTRRISLAGIDRASRSLLKPPWPDVVISAGMRNEPVCRWIKARSGGRTRLVQLGRPWVHYSKLDLVITTPQYRLPARSDVLHNLGTLHRVNPTTLAAAGEKWSARFADLPRPRIGVIVGGHSGPYTLGPNAARSLAKAASARAREAGGSLLVTTSSRTPAAAADALGGAIDVPHVLYRYGDETGENPYLGILDQSDELIVTSDSIAMLSEAVAADKGLSIFDLENGGDDRIPARLYRQLMRFGPQRLTRDLTLFHRALIDSGRAGWLRASGPAPGPGGPMDDIERSVRRVDALLGPSR